MKHFNWRYMVTAWGSVGLALLVLYGFMAWVG